MRRMSWFVTALIVLFVFSMPFVSAQTEKPVTPVPAATKPNPIVMPIPASPDVIVAVTSARTSYEDAQKALTAAQEKANSAQLVYMSVIQQAQNVHPDMTFDAGSWTYVAKKDGK